MRGLDRFIRVLSAREEDLQRLDRTRVCRHLRGNAGGGGMIRARRALLAAAAGIALAAGYSARVAADVPVIDTAALGQSGPAAGE